MSKSARYDATLTKHAYAMDSNLFSVVKKKKCVSYFYNFLLLLIFFFFFFFFFLFYFFFNIFVRCFLH